MIGRVLAAGEFLAVTWALLCLGCGSGEQPSSARATEAGAPEAIVKPMDEYREEAARDIDVEDAEAELSRLQSEIESDIEAGE